MQETVIIDFSVDYSQLEKAQEQLAKSGKIDATQFSALNKSLKTTAADTNGLIAQFKKVATTATFLGKSVENALGAGIQDALDEAGVSVKEFSDALTKANAPAKSLKAELLELKNALAQAKASGKDTGVEFEALRARAGVLADAISDANAEIKNAGSDTRGIDNVLGSVSALAGGFAAIQGAAALFGEENEDLQRALLKVNGAMALATGLQQIQNAVQKEGALAKLADAIATNGMTAAQKVYAVAVGTSTGAMKAFRVALLATGIGAIIAVLFLAADAFGLFTASSKEAKNSTDALNESLETQKEKLNALNEAIESAGTVRRNKLKEQGANERKIFEDDLADRKKQLENFERIITTNAQALADKRQSIEDNAAKLAKRSFGSITYSRLQDQKKALALELEALIKTDKETQKLRLDQARNISEFTSEFAAAEAEKQRAKSKSAAEKAAADAKTAAEKANTEARAERARQLQDELAALERRLLAVKKGGQEEIDIQKLIVAQKAKIELNAEKLKHNQIELIKEQALADQLKLQDEFNKKITDADLQASVDRNSSLLAGIEITNQERLRLSIENVYATAQIEINAAEGNAAKILLIEAKKASDIRAIRIAAIDQERADQIAADSGMQQRIKNNLLKIAADRDTDVNGRIAAIRTIERQELMANDNAIRDIERKFAEGLISEKEYNSQLKKLADERMAIDQNASDQITEIRKKSSEEQKEQTLKDVALILDVAGQVSQFYENITALGAEKDRQRIEEQKRSLDALVEAGAISEKNAKIRAQQIEILERQAKQKQAQREKQAAVFNALLAIPQAFLAGLKSGPQGLALGPIFAAIAAAQAALVIARPVPKFFRGKKDKYEGPGIVGDMGSELVERNGRMFIYTKPTQTYLHAADKVYTHSETKQILHNSNLNTTVMPSTKDTFDYERLAKMIPKPTKTENHFHKDYMEQLLENALNKTRNFDNRYKF